MSKKRRREEPNVDKQLVETYDDLAHPDEAVRLKAAHRLLTKFVNEAAVTGDQLNEILRRLIRGLCSGRKAARLGFSVALTEFLAELLGPKGKKVDGFLNISELIPTLKTLTKFSGDISGQEERDHQFGQLFGAESIIKSGILFHSDVGFGIWNDLLDAIYELAGQKPWLREESGFVLFKAVQNLRHKNSKYLQLIIDKLGERKLCETPEGIAIWISAKSECSNLNFPAQVWKYENPLGKKEKSALARVLREGTTTKTSRDMNEHKATQQGIWSSKIHFAWDVIITKLLEAQTADKESKKAQTISFGDFWDECVDKSLFASASSEERKYWGFLLFQKAIHQVPVSLVPTIFSRNFMRCFINQLASAERFLHRTADKTVKVIVNFSASSPESTIPILTALLTSPLGDVNFDKITKSRTIETLLLQIRNPVTERLIALYERLILHPRAQDEKNAASRRITAADHLVLAARNMHIENTENDTASAAMNILNLFAKISYFDLNSFSDSEGGKPDPPITQATRQIFRTRISTCLAHLLANSVDHTNIAYNLVRSIQSTHKDGKLVLKTDKSVSDVLSRARKVVEKAYSREKLASSGPRERNYFRSVVLLYSLTILQVHNEDAEAVSILEELNDLFEGQLQKQTLSAASTPLVEILLSFISKPSQLFRRLAQEVFASCASNIDQTGLESMTKILETTENIKGQADVFEQNDEEDDKGGSSEASDSEEMQLDETESATSVSENEKSDDDSDEMSDSADNGEAPDEELAAFDAKLAQALGTQPGHEDPKAGDSNSSDEDMNDEQMEALDEHLEQVFREQKKLTSKKTEKKDAKETIINFKCRVLELLDIYVKQRHADTLALGLLLPVLTLIRTTKSPLVSSKACNLVREYSKLCKGDGLPKVEHVEAMFSLLEQIHIEAGKEGSNAHASACSQASLLIVKVLVAHDRESLRRVVKIYGVTQELFLFDADCKVKTSFFSDWLNWCTSARK